MTEQIAIATSQALAKQPKAAKRGFLFGEIKLKTYVLYNNADGILVGEIDASSEEAALTEFKSEYYLLNKYNWEALEHGSLATSNKSHIIMHKDVFIHHLMQKCQKPLFR